MSRTHDQLRAAEAARGEAPRPARPAAAPAVPPAPVGGRRSRLPWRVGALGLVAGVGIGLLGPWRMPPPEPPPETVPAATGAVIDVGGNGGIRLKLDPQLRPLPPVSGGENQRISTVPSMPASR